MGGVQWGLREAYFDLNIVSMSKPWEEENSSEGNSKCKKSAM